MLPLICHKKYIRYIRGFLGTDYPQPTKNKNRKNYYVLFMPYVAIDLPQKAHKVFSQRQLFHSIYESAYFLLKTHSFTERACLIATAATLFVRKPSIFCIMSRFSRLFRSLYPNRNVRIDARIGNPNQFLCIRIQSKNPNYFSGRMRIILNYCRKNNILHHSCPRSG